MKYFTTNITLFVDPFYAENAIDAERIINEYIDVVADIAPASLTWSSCDWDTPEEWTYDNNK
jgi:hypothetical protein